MKRILTGCLVLAAVVGWIDIAAASYKEVLQTIENELAVVKGHEVDVVFRQGTVTLKGAVDSPATLQRIDRIVSSVDGVEKVRNYLVVDPSRFAMPMSASKPMMKSMAAPSDGQIQSRIEQILQKIPGGSKVKVAVASGVVTLTGDQGSFRQVDRVLANVLNVDGVVDIHSNLTVNGKPYPARSAMT